LREDPGKVDGLLMVGGCVVRLEPDRIHWLFTNFDRGREEPRGEKVGRFCCDGEMQIEEAKARTRAIYVKVTYPERDIFFLPFSSSSFVPKSILQEKFAGIHHSLQAFTIQD